MDRKSHRAPSLNEELQATNGCWEMGIQYKSGTEELSNPQQSALNRYLYLYLYLHLYLYTREQHQMDSEGCICVYMCKQ